MTQLRPTPVRSDPGPAATSRLQINLARIAANFNALREAAAASTPRPRVCAVVKKDAYGLGLEPVARRLAQAGADMLAVFSADEARQLAQHHAITCPLLVLMPMRELDRTDPLYRLAVAGRLHLALHDPQQVDELDRLGRTFGIRVPVHLHLDTGMSRAGLSPDQLTNVLFTLLERRNVELAGVWSHLATADGDPDFAYDQLQRFHAATGPALADRKQKPLLHIANSYGILRDAAFHLDMIRPGLGLFGYGACDLTDGPRLDPQPELLHAVRWTSRLVHIQQYPAGTTVGYGSTRRLDREATLGVVPVGYGDGYPLALSDKASVRVNLPTDPDTWREAAVLGRVNMDQIVVDLTNAGGGEPNAWLDAAVELIADDPAAPNALPRLARLADSHCYELLCRLSPYLPRQYTT